MSDIAEQLDKCAQEQVQLIGHIQPHGLLLALTDPDLIVRYVSGNVDSILGISAEALLGRSIGTVLRTQEFDLLRAKLSGPQPAVWTVNWEVGGRSLELDCVAHRQAETVILEFELPPAGSVAPFDVATQLTIPLLHLESATDIAQLSQISTNEIQRLTGFERVMVYRFDDEWNGEIMAEAMGDSGISYSGLRFPASDIPPQVRALCLINRVRVIADVDATPVPILAETPSAPVLDLTRSHLRSSSPIHLEYLRNMRVSGSITFSIVVKGRLWGMFSCHHPTPYRLNRSARSAAEIIVQIFASQVALRLDNAEMESSLAGRSLLENFMTDLARTKSVVGSIPRQNLELVSIFAADGMLASVHGVTSTVGLTADEEWLRSIARRLKDIAVQGIASSHNLGALDPAAVPHAPQVSGALYIELPGKDDYLLFLRRELIETVIWAGNPRKAVLADKDDRLHPRLSFEAWRETLRGRSRRWTVDELRMAALLRDRLERRDRARAFEVLTARFNLATREANVGVWERWDETGNIWWSEVMYRIFGRDPASFEPNLEKWIMCVHPEDRKRIRVSSDPAVGPRTSAVLRYRIVRPDGSIRHVESVGATEWVDGSISGILLDVTDRVAVEVREEDLQRQLRDSSRQAGMAEIAIGVLHNVGNVLNSLGVANAAARRSLNAVRVQRLEQTSALIEEHRATLGTFLTDDERGRHLPDYLKALSAQLAADVGSARAEIDTIEQLLQHLRDIVSAQQAYAKIGGLLETVSLQELAETALLVLEPKPAAVDLVTDYEDVPPVTTDRHKLLQILVNLISNARDAVQASPDGPHRVLVRIYRDADHAMVSVEDSGVGMTPEVIERLWRFGFTTKSSGYGFGLHHSANAARELGATITAHSDGPGKGSRFVVRLPLEQCVRSESG
jgi:light-regulated signal transduction histidine kinase (bacteriophytochrome)